MSKCKYDALKLDNQLCFPLYAAARGVVKQYRPFLDEIDLTYTQYVTMLVLWEHKSISVKDLGKKLYLDSGTLTPVLKSLEAKGFVRRFRSREDERILIVELTDDGAALREKAVNIPKNVAACMKLEADDADSLYALLYKLLGLLD